MQQSTPRNTSPCKNGPRMKHILLLTALLTAGCVPAKDTAPIIALQRDAAIALAQHAAQDQAALTAATTALIDIHRTASSARLEARALTLLFRSAQSPTIGGLTGQPASDWLKRYESAANQAQRQAIITELPDQQRFNQDAEAVLEAVTYRGARAAALFADLLDSTALLEAYADQEATLASIGAREILAELYAQELRERFDDPEKQAAADRIAALILGAKPENTQ